MFTTQLRLGILVGVLVFIVGHFATQHAIQTGRLIWFWLVLGLLVGFLVSLSMNRTKKEPKTAEPTPPEEDPSSLEIPPEMPSTVSTTGKFFAISRTPSSSELKALMVDAPTLPGNPIATRFKLIVQKHDFVVSIPPTESALLDYSAHEIAERAMEEANSRAPGGANSAQFSLVYLRSEGPLDASGRSPFGWTFIFVDGSQGIRCTVIVAPDEILLVYDTAVSYPRILLNELVDLSDGLRLIYLDHPEVAERDLYVRINFPADYNFFMRNPLSLFCIGGINLRLACHDTLSESGLPAPDKPFMTTRELLQLLSEPTPPAEKADPSPAQENPPEDLQAVSSSPPVEPGTSPTPTTSAEEVAETFAPGAPTPELAASEQALQRPEDTPPASANDDQNLSPPSQPSAETDQKIDSKQPTENPAASPTESADAAAEEPEPWPEHLALLRQSILEKKLETISDTARHLLDDHGPQVVQQLEEAIADHEEGDPIIRKALLMLLAYLPSDLALLSLHRLSQKGSEESRATAQLYFDKRRNRELRVFADPIEPLGFEESRALIGKTGSRRLALESTYDPETKLLPVLEKAGLKPTRIRLLSGDTDLFLSASLRCEDGDTEALLSSSPLPIPCLILRIVGPETNQVVKRIIGSGIWYSPEQILKDVKSGRPYVLHRAALYMAALELDDSSAYDALSAGILGNKHNTELRRACLAALAQLDHEGVVGFLERLKDPDLMDLVVSLLENRRQAEKRG